MAMTAYGRNLYANVMVGKQAAPDLYLALCNVMPVDSDTGSSISEGPTSRTQITGTAYDSLWSSPANGSSTYTGSLQIGATTADHWGTIVGYALCDTQDAGTGNAVFYGSLTPFTVNASIIYLDIQGIKVSVS